jgi:glycosyltransferase involved in cell wall biosynthesis
MRILMGSFFSEPEEGGAEKQGRVLAAELARRGVEVSYVTARHPGGNSFLSDSGVRVCRIPVGPRVWGFNRLVGEALYATGLRRFLIRQRGCFDVVHALGAFELTAPVFASAAPAIGARSLVRFASLGDLDFLRSKSLVGRLTWRSILAADRFVGNAPGVLDNMTGRYHLAPGRCVLVPNAIEIPVACDRAQVRAMFGWHPDCKVVLNVSKFNPLKNQAALLNAWPFVLRQFPAARLVLVGSGRCLERCRRLAVQLGIDGSVTFAGAVPNNRVLSYLAASDLFVFVSKYEGQPNVVLEAMASDVPCVLSSIAGNRSLADRGTEAEFCDPDDAADIARAIGRVLADPAYAAHLRAGAARRVREHHSVAAVCDQYVRVYEDLIADLLPHRCAEANGN